MPKVISKTLARIHNLQDKLAMLTHREAKLAHVEAIRARVSRMVEGAAQVTRNAPMYWQRPAKGYKLPSYAQWRKWLASRVGTLPLVKDTDGARVLCIACGFPIAVSSGDKTLRGRRDGKVMEHGGLSKVTVGAIVKLKDTEDVGQDWKTGAHGFMEMPHAGYADDDIEPTDKVIIVTHRALGCDHCQRQYAKVKADVIRDNERRRLTYHGKRTEYLAKVRELIAQSPEMPVTEQRALLTFHGDVPKDKTPYIAVDVKVIHPEQTVAYWHGQQFKPVFTRKKIVPSYGPEVEVTIPVRDIAYTLALDLYFQSNPQTFEYESDIPFTPRERVVPQSVVIPQAIARETIQRRIYIPLVPIGICHHARGVMPIVRTGRRPGVYA